MKGSRKCFFLVPYSPLTKNKTRRARRGPGSRADPAALSHARRNSNNAVHIPQKRKGDSMHECSGGANSNSCLKTISLCTLVLLYLLLRHAYGRSARLALNTAHSVVGRPTPQSPHLPTPSSGGSEMQRL